MADGQWRRGCALLACHGLHFELQTPWWHLHEAADLARDFPDTPIVINHAGMPPDRSRKGLAAWRSVMAGVAQCPNVALKISGIDLPGGRRTLQDNRPVVLGAIDLFGVDRCMFGASCSTTTPGGPTRSPREPDRPDASSLCRRFVLSSTLSMSCSALA